MKKSNLITTVVTTLLVTLVAPASSRAQSDAPVTPAPVVATSSGGGGTGAGFGVGAAAFLSGPTGIDFVYDMPKFHIEGLIGFDSVSGMGNMDRVTNVQFGVRGWYHLHNGSRSDFSAGGGIGLVTVSGGNNPPTATVLEPGFQARVFLTPNFALHMTGGLTMRFGNNVGQTGTQTGFGLTAQLMAGVGLTYFFI